MGLSVGTIILPPFPFFFRRRQKILINKRRNSDPATSNNADFDIAAPRKTEKRLLNNYMVDLFVFSRLMGHGDLWAVFRGEWYIFLKKGLSFNDL